MDGDDILIRDWRGSCLAGGARWVTMFLLVKFKSVIHSTIMRSSNWMPKFGKDKAYPMHFSRSYPYSP